MVTCSMCIPVRVKNVPPNCGTVGAQGLANGVMPSPISLLHSIPCNTLNAVPNPMVANSQLRRQGLSPRCATNTAITIVRELESRHAVIIVDMMMLYFANLVCQLRLDNHFDLKE